MLCHNVPITEREQGVDDLSRYSLIFSYAVHQRSDALKYTEKRVTG